MMHNVSLRIMRSPGLLAIMSCPVLLLMPRTIGADGHGPDVPYSLPGKLVDLDGYKLHLHATGKGKPTVVLIPGAGDYSFDWNLVQPSLARLTQVCSYDRAGFAWSDLGPTPRTVRQEANEVHLLLKNARIEPPYVLVGHSLGGLIVRVYADQYPDEVTGVVLVDSTHEDTVLLVNAKLVRVREGAKDRPIPSFQTMKSSPPKPPTEEDLKQADFNAKVFGAPKTEPPFDRLPVDVQKMRLWFRSNPKFSAVEDTFWAEELQAMHVARVNRECPLSDKPLVVMIPSDQGPASPPPGVSAETWKVVLKEKREQKLGLTKLSHNSKLIIAERSGHHVQLDQPELVIQAIREVVEAARQGSKLTTKPKPR